MEMYFDKKKFEEYLRLVLETYEGNPTFVQIPKIQIDHIIEMFNDLISENDYEKFI